MTENPDLLRPELIAEDADYSLEFAMLLAFGLLRAAREQAEGENRVADQQTSVAPPSNPAPVAGTDPKDVTGACLENENSQI